MGCAGGLGGGEAKWRFSILMLKNRQNRPREIFRFWC